MFFPLSPFGLRVPTRGLMLFRIIEKNPRLCKGKKGLTPKTGKSVSYLPFLGGLPIEWALYLHSIIPKSSQLKSKIYVTIF
jgi:hypothetical protein